MKWYRYKGVEVQAETEAAAKALANAQLAGEVADPTEGMSGLDKFVAGVGSGMMNVGRQVGNMIGAVPDSAINEQRSIDAPLLNTGAGTAGRITGEIAATAPLGVGAGAAATRVIGGRVLPLAVEAATEGAILAGPEGRGGGAAGGAALGGALGLAGKVGSAVVRGARGTPEAQHLVSRGVDLTPGQMNPGGVMSAVEESAAGRLFPTTAQARQSAKMDAFREVLSNSRAPGTGPLRTNSMEHMMGELRTGYRNAYDSVKGYRVPRSHKGKMFESELMDTLRGHAGIRADDLAAELSWLKQELGTLGRGIDFDIEDALKIRSRIRGRSRDAYRRQDFDTMQALDKVEALLTARAAGALPRKVAGRLRATDKAYRRYKIAEDMAWKAGDNVAPTPHQMSTAVRSGEMRKGAYASGAGELRDITRPSRRTFAEHTPPTGMGLAIPMAGAAAGHAMGGPAGAIVGSALPSAVGAVMAGTRTGRNAYRGNTAGQRLLQKALDAYRNRGGETYNALLRAGAVQQTLGE